MLARSGRLYSGARMNARSLVLTGLAAALSLPASTAAAAVGDGTFIYSKQGRLLASIREVKSLDTRTRLWSFAGRRDCSVTFTNTGINVILRRAIVGRAVPAGYGRWNVASNDLSLRLGIVGRQSRDRWTIRSARGTVVGFTRGPAGPAAAAAWLLLPASCLK